MFLEYFALFGFTAAMVAFFSDLSINFFLVFCIGILLITAVCYLLELAIVKFIPIQEMLHYETN
ncbi:MAG: hypothetical protein V2A75_09650 [Pseudomonadota bacterium]